MRTCAFHPEAQYEYVEAAEFYEQCSPGLGKEFTKTIERAIETVVEAPYRRPVLERDIRRYVVSRFPYGLFYRIKPDVVFFVAVAHGSREPGYWRRRLN